jgi:hypothetical protein
MVVTAGGTTISTTITPTPGMILISLPRCISRLNANVIPDRVAIPTESPPLIQFQRV